MKKRATTERPTPRPATPESQVRHERDVLRSALQAIAATGAVGCPRCRDNGDAARYALSRLEGAS